MPDPNSIINIGDLTKPATVLIERVSDAIGGLCKPWQIRRTAKANQDADIMAASAKLEISELERRSLQRLIAQESQRQENMESVALRAAKEMGDDSNPGDLDDDWIRHFFDSCKDISDEEMQVLWSKVLAGEANKPGSYRKRTVNVLSAMDKSEANMFASLCSFIFLIAGRVPLIFDTADDIYKSNNVTFHNILHLESIGLITSAGATGFVKQGFGKNVLIGYFEKRILLEFPKESGNQMDVGKVFLSNMGNELAAICASEPNVDILNYAVEKLKSQNIKCVIQG